jgi:hypothetical protein
MEKMPRNTAREMVDKSLPAGVYLLPSGSSSAKKAVNPHIVEARPSIMTNSAQMILAVYNLCHLFVWRLL